MKKRSLSSTDVIVFLGIIAGLIIVGTLVVNSFIIALPTDLFWTLMAVAGGLIAAGVLIRLIVLLVRKIKAPRREKKQEPMRVELPGK